MTSLHDIPSASHSGSNPPNQALAFVGARPIAQAGVQRGEIEQRHQQLGALRHVDDRLGGERVNGPHQGREQRHGVRSAREPLVKEFQAQRAAHDGPYQQCRHAVQHDVGKVVAGRIEMAEVVIHGQRPIHQGAACGGKIFRRIERPRILGVAKQRPQPRDRRVAEYILPIIENKRSVDRAAVDDRSRRREHDHRGHVPNKRRRNTPGTRGRPLRGRRVASNGLTARVQSLRHFPTNKVGGRIARINPVSFAFASCVLRRGWPAPADYPVAAAILRPGAGSPRRSCPRPTAPRRDSAKLRRNPASAESPR